MITSEMVTAKEKEKWIENFARAGIFAKGVVYCLIGLLTTLAALGLSGRKIDKGDAFKVIYDQPFGRILLMIIAVGLFGYVMWRSFQALRDIDHKGKDTKAIFIRIGYGISALIYLFLGIYAVKLSVNGPSSGEEGAEKFIASKLLDYPGGNLILAIVAIFIILNGIRQMYKGVSQKFMRNVNTLHSDNIRHFKKAGIIGYISRGVVLITIGYFFIRASLYRDAEEVEGTKGAFNFLENTFGGLLMGMIALGLLGYGIFMFVKCRYQKIDLHF